MNKGLEQSAHNKNGSAEIEKTKRLFEVFHKWR